MEKLIEKLKDPNQARPFDLLPEDEQNILLEAGYENCLFFDGINGDGSQAWLPASRHGLSGHLSYILRSEYGLEPVEGPKVHKWK